MEENKKYYTPTIEEFHPGFECEIQSSWGWQKGTWPKVLRQDSLTMQILIDKGELEATKKSSIRVKHLDQEDIESCGWEMYDGDLKVYNIYRNFEFFGLFIHGDTGIIRITKEQNTLFKGELKNKSELKKLMVQLDINEK